MAPKSKIVKIPSVKSWKFGEIELVPEGNKRFVPITLDGNNLMIQIEQAYNPFGLSDYDTGTRKTLVSQLQSEWCGPLDCMTECLIYEVTEKNHLICWRTY